MDTFTTVFEIDRSSYDVMSEFYVRLALGVAVLGLGLFGLWFRRKESVRDRFRVGFLAVRGAIWLVVALATNPISGIDRLLDAYAQGRYEVVEGEVTVGHVQPASGHSAGDEVAVGGRTFKVDYFVATPAYHDSIAHGGVLRAGAICAGLHR